MTAPALRVANLYDVPIYATLTSSSVNFSATGENSVVVSSLNSTIKIMRIFLVVSADTIITFRNGLGGTDLTGPISLLANGALVLDISNEPWFVMDQSNDFVISQTGTAQISGRVYFQR